MLSDREKVVVGTCLLVILAAVVTGCLVLFTGDGKAPSGTGLPATSGPQALLNGQTAPGQGEGSVSGLSSLQGQALLEQQQALTSQQQSLQQQSNSTSHNQQTTPTAGTVAGDWLLNVKGNVYVFQSMPVTLKKDGTVSLGGTNAGYVQVTSSHYSFDSSTRSIKIDCDCVITVAQTGTMPVVLNLKGTYNSGLTQATGAFTATSNSTPIDQGSFKLSH